MTKNEKWRAKQKNKVLSLISRGNQYGISKSNTAPLQTVIIIVDRNSKEHPQNKVNQRAASVKKKF